MSTETVLTDEQIDAILASPGDMRWVIATKKERYVLFARAIEQAVLQSVSQWQPIETAPKDGKPRLLFARLKSATASTIVVGSLIEDEWLAQSYVGQGKAVLVPSHWMPLPPFPATPFPGPVEP